MTGTTIQEFSFSPGSEPYWKRYADWLTRRRDAKGYDVGTPPMKNSPPKVNPDKSLRWWSLDRRRRLAAERSLRDRLVDDILSLPVRQPSVGRQSARRCLIRQDPQTFSGDKRLAA
jgi:hypothetical protein